MKAIDFVVRDSAGGLQRGTISADEQLSVIQAGSVQEISLNLRQIDLQGQQRVDDDLVITLSDGRVVTIDGYFNDTGAANRLFVSADGYLNEVALVEGDGGALYAQYGPTEEWGKWSPSDDLMYLGRTELVAGGYADQEVSMFAAPLLGAAGLLGGGGAATVAAVAGGAAVVGGGLLGGGGDAVADEPTGEEPAGEEPGGDMSDPGEVPGEETPDGPGGEGGGDVLPGTGDTPTPAAPFVNNADDSDNLGGDGNDPFIITVTGGGEPGDAVVVVVGGQQIETQIDDQGTFAVNFAGDTFPGEGSHEAEVTVFTTTGQVVLDGPAFVVDTIGPVIEVTSGTDSVSDSFNSESFANGVTLTGNGEAGASMVVTIGGVEVNTVVGQDGTWSATWANGLLEAGEYTTDVTMVSTDSFGNSTTVTDTLVVDTVSNVAIETATVEGEGVVNAAERDDGVTLTGTSQPGSTVMVSFGSGMHQATVDADGNWSADFAMSEVPTGETTATVTATATDSFGNSSTSTGQVDIDTLVRDFGFTGSTGGRDGVINIDEAAQGLVMTGSTEPGSTVVVSMNGASHNATVAANGSWSVNFAASEIPSGTTTAVMTAVATDAAGNSDTITRDVVIDRDAGVLTISAAPVEGDDVVNAAEASDGVVLTGTSNPFASVDVAMGGVTNTVNADAAGNWTANFSAAQVPAGVYTAEITATTTDSAGNTLNATDSFQVDTRVDNLSVNADQVEGDGVINGFERLEDGSVQVTGTTEVGSTSVVVTLNGVEVNALIGQGGDWVATYESSEIAEGTYDAALSVTAMDRAGNSRTINDTVRVDTEVVPLNMTNSGGGTDNVANFAEAATGIDLAGQVEAGSTVVVNFDGSNHTAFVDTAGNWSVTIPPSAIAAGTYDAAIVVTATDSVGNIDKINDTLAIDTQAPEGPVVEAFTRGRAGYRGIATETNDGTLEVYEVNENGSIAEVASTSSDNIPRGETNFVFNADVPDGSHLVVTSTDDAGNSSGTYLVLDDEASGSVVSLSNPALGDHNIEAIDLKFAEEGNLTLDEASLLALSENSNELQIIGGADDQVTMIGAQKTGATVRDGETYDIYTLGQEGTVVIDDQINVVI
jgi:hypothetical protein